MTTWIGWLSSALLLFTIGSQTWKQWRTERYEGVSPWLFVGQSLASTGFLVYSVLRGDPVFIAVNAMMLVAALIGLGVLVRNARRAQRARGEPEPSGVAELLS